MESKIQWFIPCYINTENGSDDEIVLDITKQTKEIFSNNVAEKKIEYGFNHGLKNITADEFTRVQITILPRFMSGYVNENRIQEFIEGKSGKIYSHFKVNNYKNWQYALGVVCIEITICKNINSIPSRDQIKDFDYNEDFLNAYHKYQAVLKEISFFFLSALHLTFPSESIMMWNDDPVNSGVMHINSVRKNFFTSMNTDNYMHHVLFERNKIKSLENNLIGISKVWHLNLWSLKRYLIAVKSNLIDMDSLLDLIYALEGLFEKNASSDFIKLFCCATLCVDKNQARIVKSEFDLAFKIRNEIAHGGQHYRGYEKIKLEGKEILSQKLYWKMKAYLSQMIIHAINKLLKNSDLKNLVFKTDDLFEIMYKK